MKLADYLYKKKVCKLFNLTIDEVNKHLLSIDETEALKVVFLRKKEELKGIKIELKGIDKFYNYMFNLLNCLEDNIIILYIDGALEFGAIKLDKMNLINSFQNLIDLEEGIFAIASKDGQGRILIDIEKNNSEFLIISEIDGKWVNSYNNYNNSKTST